jgi:hypothetical protein
MDLAPAGHADGARHGRGRLRIGLGDDRALAGSPLLAGAAAVLSSGLLALVVLRFRRETWRVRADGLKMVVWQPGI